MTVAKTRRTPSVPMLRPDGTPVRVLAVDDEPSLTEVLSGVLRYEGFDVRTATSGQEAVRSSRTSRPTR